MAEREKAFINNVHKWLIDDKHSKLNWSLARWCFYLLLLFFIFFLLKKTPRDVPYALCIAFVCCWRDLIIIPPHWNSLIIVNVFFFFGARKFLLSFSEEKSRARVLINSLWRSTVTFMININLNRHFLSTFDPKRVTQRNAPLFVLCEKFALNKFADYFWARRI